MIDSIEKCQEDFNNTFELLDCECEESYVCGPCELDRIFTRAVELVKQGSAESNLLEVVHFPGTTAQLSELSDLKRTA